MFVIAFLLVKESLQYYIKNLHSYLKDGDF